MFPHGMDFRGRHKAAIGLKSDYMWRWGLSPLPPMTDLDSTRLLVNLKKTNLLVNSSTCQLVNLKKLFFFFYPHTLTFRLKRPVYRGFSGEGKCEGKCFTLTLLSHLPLTPSHPYSSGKKASCLLRILWMASDSIGRNKAAVYRQYSYAALLVQLCCTFGARMLYSSGTAKTVGIPMLNCWYTYAEPLVYLC